MESFFQLVKGVLRGLDITVEVTVLSILLTYLISFLAGFGYLSKYKLIRIPSITLIEIFRGVSVLVLMFWFYFALPFLGIKLTAMTSGVLALAFNHGAYGAEIVRSSILSIPKGQMEAAIALNMSPLQRMFRVILPQAILVMLPSFGNLQIQILKASAAVSLITLADLTFHAMSLRMVTLQTTAIFIILLVIYYLLAYPLRAGISWLERSLSKGRV